MDEDKTTLVQVDQVRTKPGEPYGHHPGNGAGGRRQPGGCYGNPGGPTDCMATLDSNLSLHIPLLSSLWWGGPSYWADLVYEPNPAYPTWIPFKLINAAIIQSGIFSCDPSTLSDDLKVHIPALLYPDGITRMWVDMEYSSVLSTDSQA